LRISRELEHFTLSLLQIRIRKVLEATQPLGCPCAPIAYPEVVTRIVEYHAWPNHDVLLLGIFLGELLDVHPDQLWEANSCTSWMDPAEVIGVVLEELVKKW
jgi:hypothetical protein